MSMVLQILVIWIATIIASKGMDLMLFFRMFKDLADAGYKIDSNRLEGVNQQLNPRAKETTRLEKMIPVYNLMKAYNRIYLYVKSRDVILNQFDVMDVLEEMTKLEKEEYNKKPTGFNALLAPIKAKLRLQKATSIKINDDEGESKIIYESGEKFADIKILEVTGPLSKLSEEEQKAKIVEMWKRLIKCAEEEFGNLESFAEACKKNEEIIIDKSTDELEPEQKSISEQKQELQNLRDELTSQEQKQNNHQKKL